MSRRRRRAAPKSSAGGRALLWGLGLLGLGIAGVTVVAVAQCTIERLDGDSDTAEPPSIDEAVAIHDADGAAQIARRYYEALLAQQYGLADRLAVGAARERARDLARERVALGYQDPTLGDIVADTTRVEVVDFRVESAAVEPMPDGASRATVRAATRLRLVGEPEPYARAPWFRLAVVDDTWRVVEYEPHRPGAPPTPASSGPTR